MLGIYLTQVLEVITRTDGGTLLYYSYDGRDEKRNTARAVLRGLLYQLLEQYPYLARLIQRDFNGPKSQEKYTVKTLITLWKLFLTLLQHDDLRSVVCTLDGLDECEEASVNPLLGIFQEFFAKSRAESSARCLKLLVLSRESPTCIERWLCQFPRVKLDDSESNNEVKREIE
jgi:hypothetical protein